MSIKNTLANFFDNALEATFNRKEADPAKLRKPLLRGIEKAKAQFENGQTKAPNRWWKVSNGVVALTVKVNGDTFDINGVATNHMPQERFVEFLDKFTQAVNAGEFDAELGDKGNGSAEVHIPKARKARVAKPAGEAGASGRGWSDERRARFQASIEARKAAKG